MEGIFGNGLLGAHCVRPDREDKTHEFIRPADDSDNWSTFGPRCNGRVVPCAAVKSVGGDEEVNAIAAASLLPARRPEAFGAIIYDAHSNHRLIEPPLRSGAVRHLAMGPTVDQAEDSHFVPARLSLHQNGIRVENESDGTALLSVAFSPFSLVQACRLHKKAFDDAAPTVRLFKVAVFHYSAVHLFAVEGSNAEQERARWVADCACAIRIFTQSLFPNFRLNVDPVPGVMSTQRRLLAGYLLTCHGLGLRVAYCELQCHAEGASAFATYEDETCEKLIFTIPITMATTISERVGVDCSCFIVDTHDFVTRTVAEKSFWLRVISNIKVKLRHGATNASTKELVQYRASIREHAPAIDDFFRTEVAWEPLLPRIVKPVPRNFPKPVAGPEVPPTVSPESAEQDSACHVAQYDVHLSPEKVGSTAYEAHLSADLLPSPRDPRRVIETPRGPDLLWGPPGPDTPRGAHLEEEEAPCHPAKTSYDAHFFGPHAKPPAQMMLPRENSNKNTPLVATAKVPLKKMEKPQLSKHAPQPPSSADGTIEPYSGVRVLPMSGRVPSQQPPVIVDLQSPPRPDCTQQQLDSPKPIPPQSTSAWKPLVKEAREEFTISPHVRSISKPPAPQGDTSPPCRQELPSIPDRRANARNEAGEPCKVSTDLDEFAGQDCEKEACDFDEFAPTLEKNNAAQLKREVRERDITAPQQQKSNATNEPKQAYCATQLEITCTGVESDVQIDKSQWSDNKASDSVVPSHGNAISIKVSNHQIVDRRDVSRDVSCLTFVYSLWHSLVRSEQGSRRRSNSRPGSCQNAQEPEVHISAVMVNGHYTVDKPNRWAHV